MPHSRMSEVFLYHHFRPLKASNAAAAPPTTNRAKLAAAAAASSHKVTDYFKVRRNCD